MHLKQLFKKKEPKEKKKKLSLRRTLSNLRFSLSMVWQQNKLYFLVYFTEVIIWAPLGFLNGTFLLYRIIDAVETQRPTEQILTFILVIAGIDIGLAFVSNFFWYVVFADQWTRFGAFLNKKLFRKACEVELACYENPEYYDRFLKASGEVQKRSNTIMQNLRSLISTICNFSLNAALILWIDPVLVLFALIPVLSSLLRERSNRLAHDHKAARKPVERRMSYIRRTSYRADFSKEMRLGFMHPRFMRELEVCFEDYKKILKKYGWRRVICDFFIDFGLEVVTVLGATAYAVIRALTDGSMSIADCVIVCTSIGGFSGRISGIVQRFSNLSGDALYMEDIRDFLEYEPKIQDGPEKLVPPTENADIEMEHVSFCYDGADSDSLTDVSLKIKSGEKIALVGLNGSGKTTLVKLLLRLYDPTEGIVRLCGTDAREYAVQSYREAFNCVFQDFGMFAMTVRENTVLRAPQDGDEALVRDALQKSGAAGKIDSLNNGIETQLTREFDRQGTNLSVGEEQKVALARAFARPAPVIILDEPSSALDPKAEYEMFENMKKAAEGKTVIYISHRLSSAVDADRIILLDKGRVAETGTHAELMQKNGAYAEMFRLQAKNYADSTSEEV